MLWREPWKESWWSIMGQRQKWNRGFIKVRNHKKSIQILRQKIYFPLDREWGVWLSQMGLPGKNVFSTDIGIRELLWENFNLELKWKWNIRTYRHRWLRKIFYYIKFSKIFEPLCNQMTCKVSKSEWLIIWIVNILSYTYWQTFSYHLSTLKLLC